MRFRVTVTHTWIETTRASKHSGGWWMEDNDPKKIAPIIKRMIEKQGYLFGKPKLTKLEFDVKERPRRKRTR